MIGGYGDSADDIHGQLVGQSRWREIEGRMDAGEKLPPCQTRQAEVFSLRLTRNDKRLPWSWHDDAQGANAEVLDAEDHPPFLRQITDPHTGREVSWLGFGPGRYLVTPPNGDRRVCYRWAESQNEGFTSAILIAFDHPPPPGKPIVFLDTWFGFRLGASAAYDYEHVQGHSDSRELDVDPDAINLGLIDLQAREQDTPLEEAGSKGSQPQGHAPPAAGMVRTCWRSAAGFVYHFVMSQSTLQIFKMGKMIGEVAVPAAIATNMLTPSPLSLGCDHRGSNCLKGRVRYMHYVNSGTLTSDMSGAAQQVADNSVFFRPVSIGSTEKCPPYAQVLLANGDPVEAYVGKPAERPSITHAAKYLRRAMPHGSLLSLRCVTEGANLTYHGSGVEEDTIKCGAVKSGEWPARILECMKDCDPTNATWWNDTDLGGAAVNPRYKLVSPRRATRLRHGERVQMQCGPGYLPPVNLPSETTLWCNDGHLDQLDLPCKDMCPSLILAPPDYTQPLSRVRYRVTGGEQGRPEGATRTIRCAEDYRPSTTSGYKQDSQVIYCRQGNWTDVALQCIGSCGQFRFPTHVDATRYVTDPPYGEVATGASVTVSCAAGFVPRKGQKASERLDCVCFGKKDQCDDAHRWRYTEPRLDCKASCGRHPFDTNTTDLYTVDYGNTVQSVSHKHAAPTVPYLSEVRITCNATAGYGVRYGLEEAVTSQCTGGTRDSSDPYTRVDIQCYRKCLSPPESMLPSGDASRKYLLTYTGGAPRTVPFLHGSSVALSCAANAHKATDQMVDKQTLVCMDGNWTQRALTCKADCGPWTPLPTTRFQTLPPQEELVQSPSQLHGFRVRVQCQRDRSKAAVTDRELPNEEQHVTCLDGQWTPLTILCKVPCGKLSLKGPSSLLTTAGQGVSFRWPEGAVPEPRAVSDMYVLSSESPLRSPSPHGTRVTIECDTAQHFHPFAGPDTKDIVCTDGHWSQQDIICGPDCPVFPSFGPPSFYHYTSLVRRVSSVDRVIAPEAAKAPSLEAPVAVISPVAQEFYRKASYQPCGAKLSVQCNQQGNFAPRMGPRPMRSRRIVGGGTFECMAPCGPYPIERLSFPELYSIRPLSSAPPREEAGEPEEGGAEERPAPLFVHGSRLLIKCDTAQRAAATPREPGQVSAVCVNGTWSPVPPPFICSQECVAPQLPASYEVMGTVKSAYRHGGCRSESCRDLSEVIDHDRFPFRLVSEPEELQEDAVCEGVPRPRPTEPPSTTPLPENASALVKALAMIPPMEPDPAATRPRIDFLLSDFPRHGSCVIFGCAVGEGADVESLQWRSVSCAAPGDTRGNWKDVFGSNDCTTLRCLDGQWTPREFDCKDDCPPPLSKRHLPGVVYVEEHKDVYKHGEVEYLQCTGYDRIASGFAALPPHPTDHIETVTCDAGRFEDVTLICRKRCPPFFPPFAPLEAYVVSPTPVFDPALLDADRRVFLYQLNPAEADMKAMAALEPHFRHNSGRWIECAKGWSDPSWPAPRPDFVECYNGTWAHQIIRCRRQCPGVAFHLLNPALYKVEYSGRRPEPKKTTRQASSDPLADLINRLLPTKPGEPIDTSQTTQRERDTAYVWGALNRSRFYDDGVFMKITCLEGDLTRPIVAIKAEQQAARARGEQWLPTELEDCSDHQCDVMCARGTWTELKHYCHRRCPPFIPPERSRKQCDPPEHCKEPEDLSTEERNNPFFSPDDGLWRHGSTFLLKCTSPFCPHPAPENSTVRCNDGEWEKTTLECRRPCLARMDVRLYRPDEEALRYQVADAEDNVPPTGEDTPRIDGETGQPLPLYIHGSRQLVSCNTTGGYQSVLPRPADMTACQDGVWTLTAIMCRRDCPPIADYFAAFGESQARYVVEGGGDSTRHGTVLQVSCAPRHSPVEGEEAETVECNDGTWWPLILRYRKMCVDYIKWASAHDPSLLDTSQYWIHRPQEHLVDKLMPAGRSLTVMCAPLHSSSFQVAGSTALDRQQILCEDGEYTKRLIHCEANCPEYTPEQDYGTDPDFGGGLIVQDVGVGLDTIYHTHSIRNGATRRIKCCQTGELAYQLGSLPDDADTSWLESSIKCRWNWASYLDEPPYEDEVRCYNGQWTLPALQCYPMCLPFGQEMVHASGNSSDYLHPVTKHVLGPINGLVPPGAEAQVRCDKGYLPEPQQDLWNTNPPVTVRCTRGYMTAPYVCIKTCPKPYREKPKMVRYNIGGGDSAEYEALTYEQLLAHRPWIVRHRGRYFAFCYTPDCRSENATSLNDTIASRWNGTGRVEKGDIDKDERILRKRNVVEVRKYIWGCLNRRRSVTTFDYYNAWQWATTAGVAAAGLASAFVFPPAAIVTGVLLGLGVIDFGSSLHIYYFKWFWPKAMHNGFAARVYGEWGAKQYECLWGVWVPRPDATLECEQSRFQQTCIDAHTTVWTRKKHEVKPRHSTNTDTKAAPRGGRGWLAGFASSFQSLSGRLRLMSNIANDVEGRSSGVGSLLTALLELVLAGGGVSRSERGGGEAVRLDGLEPVSAAEVEVGDQILSYGSGRPRLTEVYFRESYPAQPTRVIDIDVATTPCPSGASTSSSLRLSPSHRLPVFRQQQQHGRHRPLVRRVVRADEVRLGDMLATVVAHTAPPRHTGLYCASHETGRARGDNVTMGLEGEGGVFAHSYGRVTGVRGATKRCGLELLYMLDSHMVANGLVITDSDEPMDAHMPYTYLSNLDTRMVYWLFGAAGGVNSSIFRAYWRWSVGRSDFVQSIVMRRWMDK
ncbi:unnamed protein product [Vitrella brassicaformis CCMP3155]|uniref:Sushi domain-containing protein n=3 Tax=Vitrella brassicaformis TaxID=1169539 RepID=A0A0G4EC72_VITBC|nr:unnamed protein product [Vitrella brassicaformis CCMP3155]|eukprot:CEL93093.1 unnamed protein product [Vitrella brassicaformis CCMP3155]